MRICIIAIALCLQMAATHAQVPEHLKATVVIDFSDATRTGNTQHGYRIASPNFSISVFDGARANNGTPILAVFGTSVPVTLSQVDGLPFDLISLDLAEYSTFALPDDVDFIGTKADGETVEFRFTPDQIIDGDGPLVDFEPVQFPATWTDLISVQLVDGSVALDNISVRGLDLATHHNASQTSFPLEIVTIFEPALNRSIQGVSRLEGDTIYTEGIATSVGSPHTAHQKAVSLTTGLITGSGFQTTLRAKNLITGEIAFVSNADRLVLTTADNEHLQLARVGEDGITNIDYPRPGNGKALFVNNWYQGEEKYAVFIASPDSVSPVILPDTILPDGGTPHYFPTASFFTGNSFAIPTSTSVSDSLYIVSFNNGPLHLSPAAGQTIPGTEHKFSNSVTLEHLSDTGATFFGRTKQRGGYLARVSMGTDGTWTTTLSPDPAWFEELDIPGSGAYLSHQSSILSGTDNTLVSYGPIERDEKSQPYDYGLVVPGADGTRHLMIQGGVAVEGFGTIDQIFRQALVQDGWFYAVAGNSEGTLALLKSRVPQTSPKLRTGEFLPMADGTVRFMVHHLNHGRSYQVDRAESLTGPWERASSFTAGSESRSVFGNFQFSGREFYRVVEFE